MIRESLLQPAGEHAQSPHFVEAERLGVAELSEARAEGSNCWLLWLEPVKAILDEHGNGGRELSSEVPDFVSGWPAHIPR